MYVGTAKASLGQTGNALIDLRSDTVTRPSPGMLAAMAAAEVGDDVFGDDPTVIALEEKSAYLFGKEAALFLSTGTQSNLCAMLAHCGRGEEILVGRPYHVFSAEAHGASVLGGIALDPLDVAADNSIDPQSVRAAVKPDDPHLPITRLLSLENTVTGKAVPLEKQEAAADAAREFGLAVHLDAARGFNAAEALGIDAQTLARCADSVSVCLSKGLGTPAGTVLCGPKDLIVRARRYRKMLGGGMRQVGILAAAGIFALDHHAPRIAEDHARAARLRQGLSELPGLSVDQAPNQTNMVLVTLTVPNPQAVQEDLRQAGIVTGLSDDFMRLVVHRDIDDAGIERTIDAFAQALVA
ncbi:MAG: low-specificity L-threonine aldolase [Alphaproteobacteria bacterium]|nr:low-specificity L-threonine aldolase [Alphaproteobacteria bacterium]